jgi:hypothetical protein
MVLVAGVLVMAARIGIALQFRLQVGSGPGGSSKQQEDHGRYVEGSCVYQQNGHGIVKV